MGQAPEEKGSAMFRGSFVALITPFRNGAIDDGALAIVS